MNLATNRHPNFEPASFSPPNFTVKILDTQLAFCTFFKFIVRVYATSFL